MDDDLWDTVATSVDLEDNSNEAGASGNLSKKVPAINFTPRGTKKLYITKSGAFIKFEYLARLPAEYLKVAKKIENYFTLRSKTITGALKQLKCCRMDKANKRMIVPRFGVFEILNDKYKLNGFTTVSQINVGELPSRKFQWCGTQTNNQILITSEILENYFTPERAKLGSAGVIVNLEAGQGKSYLAAYLISKIQKKTAIILHTTALIEQWVKVLQNALGETVSIGYYYAKKKKAGDIMLFIIDSAANDEFTIAGETFNAVEFYNRFGLVILDECHMYSSKTALKALRAAQAPYMLGLSATPDEHVDGYDQAVWWSIGPILDAQALPGYVATSDDFTAEVHRIMYYGPQEYTRVIVNKTTEMTSIAETINMICEDPARNQVIIDCILEGLELGLYMFVFADRRDYLTILQETLKEQRQIEGEIVDSDEDFVRVVGGAKAEELENAEINSKVIFTTYQYMGTGKSVVKMNGLVLATPRKTKMKQYINRIFRLGSDTTIKRHIYDICDMKLKLSNQWSTRVQHYKSKNYPITTKKIKYSDVEIGGVAEVFEAEDIEGSVEDGVGDGVEENTEETQEETQEEEDEDTQVPKTQLSTKSSTKPVIKKDLSVESTKKILSIADSLVARIKKSK